MTLFKALKPLSIDLLAIDILQVDSFFRAGRIAYLRKSRLEITKCDRIETIKNNKDFWVFNKFHS